MASLRTVAITAALLTVSSSSVTAYPAPVAADGWSHCLVATDLKRPRGIVFDTEGGLIAVDSGVGLVHFTLKDGDNDCLTVDNKKTLVEDDDVCFAMETSWTIYCSEVLTFLLQAEPWSGHFRRWQNYLRFNLRRSILMAIRRL